LQNKKKENVII